ncbi:MAG: hypothetical protein ACOY0R_17145 [Chloroflexota bacterium]
MSTTEYLRQAVRRIGVNVVDEGYFAKEFVSIFQRREAKRLGDLGIMRIALAGQRRSPRQAFQA